MAAEVLAARVSGERQATIEAVEGFFAALPAAGRLGKNSRVLVKPNLLAKHAPEAAVTTHPDVLYAVIVALQKRGVVDITVADSPGGPYTTGSMRAAYKGCGFTAVCEELGAKLYTDCQSGTRAVPHLPGRLVQSFTLLQPVLDCDFIINLPKLKTHVMTYMSGAVKNLFGCVPGLQKAEFHMRFPQKEDFGRMLVDLCETVHADLHIVDGLIAMEGDGPSGGKPRRENRLFAGENPYELDLALCHVMGLDAMQAPMLAAAHKAGLCGEAFSPALAGENEALAPIPGFQPPSSYKQNDEMTFLGNLPAFLRPLARPFVRAAAPRPAIRRAACIGCGKCAEICPKDVITIADGKAKIDYSGCIRCFCCHEMCPVKAIDVKRIGFLRL